MAKPWHRQILFPKDPRKQQAATFFKSNSKTLKLSQEDPEKGELIYVGGITQLVKFVKFFSLSTSVAILGAQPMLIQSYDKLPGPLVFALGGVMGIFAFFTPVGLHYITKRYICHMYYRESNKTFTAVTCSFFLMPKEIKFTADDVKLPDMPRPFTTMFVKGKPMFADPNCFSNKDAFVHMMGYDKPIDWGVATPTEDKS